MDFGSLKLGGLPVQNAVYVNLRGVTSRSDRSGMAWARVLIFIKIITSFNLLIGEVKDAANYEDVVEGGEVWGHRMAAFKMET